ncbi:MAG: serine/threonine-protein kinase, partial [Rhodanobacteraceae bacterium]
MIEIPGYRLLRQLGRGGMATVYLAIQQSVDREVALKVMSPALLADPNFGARFLREAKIAARLHHRHVVGVHDVGRAGDYHYIAMEYLAGGPVLTKDGVSRQVPFALRVMREIATALNYAHEKGFIHRDVKPDNILLRDDRSAALTDFGIARASDSVSRMTKTGAVVGTPHYMSPEQARGKQIDGRCDIYSLGIVLYELLVGRVPYQAEDSLAVGIMHITEPVPALPESAAALQPLIDKLLAKEPDDRFQTGNEAAAAIAAYEARINAGALDALGLPQDVTHKTTADTFVSPVPFAPQGDSGAGANRSRVDPNLGRLDQIVAAVDDGVMRAKRPEQGRIRVRGRRRGRRTVALVLALFVVLVGAAAWHYQDRLRQLLPRTELNATLARAQSALVAGKLIGTDGTSASELFKQVQAE